MKKGEGNGGIKWQQLGGTNKEMEFQNWLDLIISGICALFGTSIDDLGLHSQKSQPMFEGDAKHKYQENKSRVLGNVLGYLQAYLNRIIATVNPDYEIEFVGYEREDPKEILDLDKGEVEAYKTLNEKREEKGLERLDYEWADIPQNPQTVQMYMGSQGGMSGMTDMEGMDGMGGGEMGEGMDFGEETEGGEDEKQSATGGGDFGEETEQPADDQTAKSFLALMQRKKTKAVRIVV